MLKLDELEWQLRQREGVKSNNTLELRNRRVPIDSNEHKSVTHICYQRPVLCA